MAGTCPPFQPGQEFLRATLNTVDCHAQNIGAYGFQALAAPGSSTSILLTGLLTIFVALFGYRMLFGQVPNTQETIGSVIRIGVVIALATSWPAFRTLAYDVAFQGPAELVASVGQPAGLPGTDGTLVTRLQGVDAMLAELVVIGTGKPPEALEVVGSGGIEGIEAQQRQFSELQQRPIWNRDQNAKMVAQARILFLTGAIAAFAAVRLIAGLLLALGPLFILFLLFDSTRGLFEGWLRVLAGAALGALATAVVLAVELALVEPWLVAILNERRVGNPTPSVPIELMVMALVFVLSLLAVLIATAKVARGFRIPDRLRLTQLAQGVGAASARAVEAFGTREMRTATTPGQATRTVPADEPSRAMTIANAVAASQRREAAAPARSTPVSGRTNTDTHRETLPNASAAQGSSPRTRGRVSAAAGKRDGRR